MNKKLHAFMLAVLVLLSTTLCACGTTEPSEPTLPAEMAYQVTVIGPDGNPAVGVIVKFMQEGKQVAMVPVDDKGVAAKTLPTGDYTVELVYTDDKNIGYFDPATAVLSPEKTAAQIDLMNAVGGEGVELVIGDTTVKAYNVVSGKTYVPVAKGVRNYFLFTPTQAGTYKVTTDNPDMKVGNYGARFFIQQNSIAEVKDNAFTISVTQGMIGSSEGGTVEYVIGIDGIAEDSNCVLNIERIGDPAWSVDQEPWTEYKTTHTPTKFTLELAEGQTLTYVDIMGTTEDNKIVYNEADGYYHFGTADGPKVYVHLGKNAPYVSLQVVIQGDGSMGGAAIRHYFFAENGDFIKKEDYTEILRGYFACMDGDFGVYPLTQDLVYIIQNACSKWWTPGSVDKMPAFDGCNTEIAWMFALCYVA